MLQFGGNLSSRNRDMAPKCIYRIVTLKGHGYPRRLKSFLSDPCHLFISIGLHVKFHWHLIDSFSVKVFQSLTEWWPGKERKKIREPIWQTLTLCDSNYTMKERLDVISNWRDLLPAINWRSLPELSFGIGWVSIRWPVMEIDVMEINFA